MMDNKFVTSCPNCKSILLNEFYENQQSELKILDSKMSQNLLIWLGKLVTWHSSSKISEEEFSNAIGYLTKKRIIEKSGNEIKEFFLKPKIKNLSILAMVDIRSPRFNEGQPIVFEGKLTDSFGNPISDAPIRIRSDGPMSCKSDNCTRNYRQKWRVQNFNQSTSLG